MIIKKKLKKRKEIVKKPQKRKIKKDTYLRMRR
jgi:hypothetical protein